MKAVRILLTLLISLALSSAAPAAEKQRPLATTAVQPRGETALAADGPVKAIHLDSRGRAMAVVEPRHRSARAGVALTSAPEVDVSGAPEVVDGEAITFSFAVTAGDTDLAPFTLDVEYSEGLNVGIDPQGWDCTIDGPGHASCEWVTALPAGETTGTATFSAFAQPPYGGAAECDPGRSPCAFLRAALPGIATDGWTTAMVVDGNHAPVAADDAAAVPLPAAAVTIDVLANDTEADGGPLTASVVVPPAHGTATVDPATQRILYTPGPSFAGNDTFRYRVTDPAGASATGLVTVHQLLGSVAFRSPVTDVGNVEPGHVAVRLNDLDNTTGLDLLGTVLIEPVDASEFPALLAGTGYDPAQAVSDVSVFAGSGGGASFDAAFAVSSFGVPTRLNPPLGRVWLARVKLTLSPVTTPSIVFQPSYVVVARSAGTSEVPVRVVDDVVSTPADTPLLIHPLDNDESTAGQPLSVTGLAIAEPFHFDPPFMQGTTEFAEGGGGVPFLGVLYTPPAGFTGTTQFYYAASEPPGGIINGRYDYARITVVVGGGGNVPPLAHSRADSLRHDTSRVYPLSTLATDPDGDPLTLQIVTPPAHGTATVLVAGDVRYEPAPGFAGTDFFEFRASDGTAQSNVARVSITVTNAAPVLSPIGGLTAPELSIATFTATASDPDGDVGTFSLIGAPAGAQIDTGTGQFTWRPSEAQGPGTYTFSVRVTDPLSLFGEEPVTITVAEVNAAPALTLPALPARIPAGAPFRFTATATDPDLPTNTLAFSLAGAPAGASIGSTAGTFTWTPSAAQGGTTFTFSVVVTDSGTPALAAQQSVTVVVETAAVTPTLVVSTAPDRSSPQGLGGQTLSRLAYVFVSPATGLTRVRFWLDDPARTGPPRQVENIAPFDFAGTAANGAAQAFDTRGLPNGTHVISAEVTLAGGTIVQLQGTFTVANAIPALMVSASSNRSNPRPLLAATVRDNVYVFVQPDPDAIRVRFWLDAPISQPPFRTETAAPWDLRGTAANGNAAPFDTRTISRGLHLIRATIDYPGGVSVTTFAVFFVTR